MISIFFNTKVCCVFSLESPRRGDSNEYTQNTMFNIKRGWSGGAMVLGKLPVPGRPTIWMIVGQGPTALAVGAVGVVWTFLLYSIHSLIFSLSLGNGPI